MKHEFRLVDIGEGLTEAEIVSWLVAIGDQVVEDQPVVEIETDKAVVEMPAPVTGTVIALGGDVGAVISVGEVLLVVDDGGEGDLGAGRVDQPAAEAPDNERVTAPARAPVEVPGTRSTVGHRPLATPSTRALARKLGVDLTTVTGTGPGGRIVDADVSSAGSTAASPVAERLRRRRDRASPCAVCASAPRRRCPRRGTPSPTSTRSTRSTSRSCSPSANRSSRSPNAAACRSR